jgi:hypothetical protein
MLQALLQVSISPYGVEIDDQVYMSLGMCPWRRNDPESGPQLNTQCYWRREQTDKASILTPVNVCIIHRTVSEPACPVRRSKMAVKLVPLMPVMCDVF